MQRRATAWALAFVAAVALIAAARPARALDITAAGTYIDAYRAFVAAERAPDGDERQKLWRRAADLYRDGLQKAPAVHEAPEAALNGAYAYRQLGMFAEAIDMCRILVREYGAAARLAELKPRDPRRWAERVRFTAQALEAISNALVASVAFRDAAESFEALARYDLPAPHETTQARNAAQNGAVLFANLGERARALALRERLARLEAPPDQLAAVDLILASSIRAAWDEQAPDTGPNRAARLATLAAIEGYHARWAMKGPPVLTVRAAYLAAKLRRAGGDGAAAPWCARAVRAFERYRASAPSARLLPPLSGAPEAEMAAECAYLALDAEARASFGEMGAARSYSGGAAAVVRAARADLAKAETLAQKADADPTLGSPPWSSAARARVASLHDAIHRGLAAARARGIRADALDVALVEARRAAVRGYVDAVSGARKARVTSAEVTRAARRLAVLSAELDDATPFADGLAQPPGMKLARAPDLGAAPLPERDGEM